MDNEAKMDIIQQLTDFKELEDIRHIDVYLNNGNFVSCNVSNLELNETGFLYSFSLDDGCSFKYYVPYENISYIAVTYGCPKSLNELGE